MVTFFATRALLPHGWATNVRLQVDDRGMLSSVLEGVQPQNGDTRFDAVIPGMPNLHSHAFQRAMAGLTETKLHPSDNFWSWRSVMYQFSQQMNASDLKTVATTLYREMLAAGYTSVAEFHYLHRQPGEITGQDPITMSQALMAAAQEVGIRLVLLPVLYMTGNFDNEPPNDAQKRFCQPVDRFLDLLQRLHKPISETANRHLGMAIHSLRAVPPDPMKIAIEGFQKIFPERPIHIHIAEQKAEVEACLAWSGKRPVAWLLDQFPCDEHWCLVHATHVNDEEIRAMAKAGVTVGLCPTTEANLGDGIFPLAQFRDQGGTFGIGSDSQISVDPSEELRLLEYGQRLIRQQRNIAANLKRPHVGANLWIESLQGGAQALGLPLGKLAPGYLGDFLSLDLESVFLNHLADDQLLDALIFSAGNRVINQVVVGGKTVYGGDDSGHSRIWADRYKTTLNRLVRSLGAPF